ncbi:MAG TPA: alanine racemase [Allosphingosinicella sp.]
MAHIPLRLALDGEALASNWHWLDGKSGSAACGAAVKADGYGLGAREVVRRLAAAGCRDFFVATWAEAEALASWDEGLSLAVLHGVARDDSEVPRWARPVLNSAEQVWRWRGRGPCDVMLDTGINRLGLSAQDVANGALDGLEIRTLMSHLACADEDVPANARQRAAFIELAADVGAERLSIANSAAICLGADYVFDLTRPGIALYGGIPRREAEGHIRQVVRVQAQIVQRRRVEAGEGVGYNATFIAEDACELAILNIGYADGYLRSFSGTGRARVAGGAWLPVVGRVSMDLAAVRVDAAPEAKEGDWLDLDYDLPTAAAHSGLSQYELLTTLGSRFERIWA